MDPGFSEPRGEEGRAAGGNPAPCFTPRLICSRFSPSPLCIQESEPLWENGKKKFPLDSSRRIRALLNPFPLSQENVANSALQEGGKNEEKNPFIAREFWVFPIFLTRGDFWDAEVFIPRRFLQS